MVGSSNYKVLKCMITLLITVPTVVMVLDSTSAYSFLPFPMICPERTKKASVIGRYKRSHLLRQVQHLVMIVRFLF